MAATADLSQLALKLRGKGLSDAQVVDGLRGMGFSKAEASQAVASLPATSSSTKQPPKPQSGRREQGGTTTSTPTPPGPPAAPASPAEAPSPASAASLPSIPTPDLSQVTLTPPKSLSGGDLGGFLAGLLLFTLGLNFLRYGPPRGHGLALGQVPQQAVRPHRGRHHHERRHHGQEPRRRNALSRACTSR
jgi:hypothetical protein